MPLPPDTTDRRPALEPPRFGLRTLFLVISCLCALLAAMQAAGPLGAAVLLLAILSIGAHVAGAELGKQLRENGSSPPVDEQGKPYVKPPRRKAQAHEFAPATSLGLRSSAGWVLLGLTITGMVAGGTTGWLLFSGGEGMQGLRTLVLGSVSLAVLGGIGCFAACTFIKSLAGCVWQAHRASRR